MKKTILTIILILFMCLVSCTNNNYNNLTEGSDRLDTTNGLDTTDSSSIIDSGEQQTKNISKKAVVNMFITYGEYNDDTYYIRKNSTTNSCNFLYTFCYKPEIDMFNCSVLVTTYTQTSNMYDYGSVTFAWNDFENAFFYGYHELENTAIIEFDFNALFPQSNMTYRDYNYSVKSNSFKNLTNTSDISEYAQTCFECVNQSLSYAQSILYGYISPVTLW